MKRFDVIPGKLFLWHFKLFQAFSNGGEISAKHISFG
jgi:hypothetical protein